MDQNLKKKKIETIVMYISITSFPSPKRGSIASLDRTKPRKPQGRLITRSFSFTSATTPQSFIPGEIFCAYIRRKL